MQADPDNLHSKIDVRMLMKTSDGEVGSPTSLLDRLLMEIVVSRIKLRRNLHRPRPAATDGIKWRDKFRGDCDGAEIPDGGEVEGVAE